MKVKIPLKKGLFVVEIDSLNHTLYDCSKIGTKSSNGKEIKTPELVGYYTSMKNVLTALIKKEISNSEETLDLKGYMARLRDLFIGIGELTNSGEKLLSEAKKSLKQ